MIEKGEHGNGPSLRERFVGCMLGQAVGDGLRAPFEGLTSDYIFASFGRAADIVAKPPVETLFCTDDTHMALAVAEVLSDRGGIEDESLIQAFARNYDSKRGYGQGMRRILESVILKQPWQELADNLFPGGSFGNGGAMRAAPVGLYFHDDLERVWVEAGRSAASTHRHPLGIEGAQLFALAVAMATRDEAGEPDRLWEQLYRRATQEEYQWLIRTASRLTPQDSLAILGSGLEAHRSAVTAIACFSISPNSYTKAISRALALGDDTDTVMAMTGALAGAHQGNQAIPRHLLDGLENGIRGRDDIARHAERLYEAFQRRKEAGGS